MTRYCTILTMLIFIFCVATAFADTQENYKKAYSIGLEAGKYAMNKMLKPQKGETIIITNAGFVRIDDIESTPPLCNYLKYKCFLGGVL